MPMQTIIHYTLVSPTKFDWTNVANAITQGYDIALDKAYAIYSWLCANIQYDMDYKIRSADEAWRAKSGVCQAYCELFYRIGTAAGLDVRIIVGKSRNHTGKIDKGNHAWIAVNRSMSFDERNTYPEYIEYDKGKEKEALFDSCRGLNTSTAIFIDPTWGAGYSSDGQFHKNQDIREWFDVNPWWMIFTHFPERQYDQLLPEGGFALEHFKLFPYATPSLEKYGFHPIDTLRYYITHPSDKIPKFDDKYIDDITFIELPLSSELTISQEYTVSIKKKRPCTLALIYNKEFYIDNKEPNHWLYVEDVYTIRIRPPKRGTLSVGIQNKTDESLFNIITTFKIKS